MTKNSISKLCTLSAVLVSVQIGSVLNSNSYNASATIGNAFRGALSSMRRAFSFRSSTPNRPNVNLISSRFSSLSNRETKNILNRSLIVTNNSVVVKTDNPQQSQIRPIPRSAEGLRNMLNPDGSDITTVVLNGNFHSELRKHNKLFLKNTRSGDGIMVTEWFSEAGDSVVKREIRTTSRIIITKFSEDGSSDVEIKNINSNR